ncbi:MAG: RnfABCDGE type electron transport complex subunit D [Oscillospiraceae bacterium]
MDNFIQLQVNETENQDKQLFDYAKQDKPSKHKIKYHNVIITLLALMVLPIYLYGVRVIVLLLTGLVTAFVIDFICIKLIGGKTFRKYDYSSVVTALITVMLMPATIPAWVVSVSIAIGLCVSKYPFGGTGHNIFNPAAVGVAFCALCWPDMVLRYPLPYTTYNFLDKTGIQFGPSPASVLRAGGTPKIDLFDVLLGKFSGPLGVTCLIVLFTCMLYLILRKVISKRIVFSALFVVCIFALLFPRVITGPQTSLLYELSSGAFVFGIIFMSNDPTTMPKTKNGRVFYGALIGFLVMMFRYFGQIELEFVFAILLANVFAGSCDRYADYLSHRFSRLKVEKKKSPASSKKAKVGESDA